MPGLTRQLSLKRSRMEKKAPGQARGDIEESFNKFECLEQRNYGFFKTSLSPNHPNQDFVFVLNLFSNPVSNSSTVFLLR